MAFDQKRLLEDRQESLEFFSAARNHPKFAAWTQILPEPINEALIEFEFNGFGFEVTGLVNQRCYHVRRVSNPNGYISVYGGGPFYTAEDAGRNGEPIIHRRQWLITEGLGYITHCFCWEEVIWFVMVQMRGRVKCVVGG